MPNFDLADVACPKCKEGKLIRGKRAFGCAQYKEGCNFTIKPLIAGKMVEREHLVDLLQNGVTQVFVQGFTNKAGKRFDAKLRLKEDYSVEFYFDRAEPKKEN